MTGAVMAAAADGGVPLSVTANTPPTLGLGNTATPGGNVLAVTGTSTAVGAGGSGSYTYAWAYQSGVSMTIDSPTSAATTFRRTSAAGPDSGDPIRNYSGVARVTVTDTVTTLTSFFDVTVNTRHTYTGP